MKVRSPNWAAALQIWTCPTPPANSAPAGACDPCGQVGAGDLSYVNCLLCVRVLHVAFRFALGRARMELSRLTASWTCPTPPAIMAAKSAPAGACDPCGQVGDSPWFPIRV
jgi:hypothetical protein